MDEIVILANGDFPSHPVPLKILNSGRRIVCCDGAAERLIAAGIIPSAIIGDMDSLDSNIQDSYSERIIKVTCQETNDLTKAFNYSLSFQPSRIFILGATGFREDHTLGNISLLSEYRGTSAVEVEMFTNNGKFIPISGTHTFHAPKGSSVSVFSLDNGISIHSTGLQYPLDEVVFDSWWKATLNVSVKNSFTLKFKSGRVIVFIGYNSVK